VSWGSYTYCLMTQPRRHTWDDPAGVVFCYRCGRLAPEDIEDAPEIHVGLCDSGAPWPDAGGL
jgi:hypothetical protein